MVAEVPGAKPVTVSNSVEPEGVPTETEPAETVGAAQVYEEL